MYKMIFIFFAMIVLENSLGKWSQNKLIHSHQKGPMHMIIKEEYPSSNQSET